MILIVFSTKFNQNYNRNQSDGGGDKKKEPNELLDRLVAVKR
jgi:hypothetical protein